MKTFLTIITISICSIAFGQKKSKQDTALIPFDEYEQAHAAEWQQEVEDFKRKEAAMNKFYKDIIRTKGSHIDQSRVANHQDSVKLIPNGILYIYKPKKK